jgi:hypothetical protein
MFYINSADGLSMDIQHRLALENIIEGVRYFLKMSDEHKQRSFMCCLCRDYKNEREYYSPASIHLHFLKRGFMHNYICWIKHGETRVLEDKEEKEDKAIMNYT